MEKRRLREGCAKKALKEAVIDDLDIALYTPGTWGVEFIGEDCICFDNEQEARDYFDSLTKDDTYEDSEGIELFRVINKDGDTEIIDAISIYDEDEEVDEGLHESIKKPQAKKSNLTERFMSIHEKPSTRFNKNLKKVYEMLDKYGTEKEDVDKVFNRATLKERLEMVKLLKEGTEAHFFETGSNLKHPTMESFEPKEYSESEALTKIKNNQKLTYEYNKLKDGLSLNSGFAFDYGNYFWSPDARKYVIQWFDEETGEDKEFLTASIPVLIVVKDEIEKYYRNRLLREDTNIEGKTVVQLSIAQEEPYYDCGDLCGIYEEKVILDDSKVDAFIADLTSYCKKIKSGAIYDEVEDWDIYDCFEYYLNEIFEKHGAKVYSKKKGGKASIETFEYDLY